MDTVTYSEETLISFIERHLVPVRVSSDEQPLSADFTITWTPALIVLDNHGKEHHRMVGFYTPEELIPALWLGIAKSYFNREQFEKTHTELKNLLEAHPKSNAAPEAQFLKGVCDYKRTKDPSPLKKMYEILREKYSSSEWTEHAFPYRLL
jgi:hypothetical protein